MSLLSDYMEKYNESVKIKGVNEEEVINEITVYKNGNKEISVNGSSTSTNFSKQPYFKITDGKKIARIRLDGSGYEYHTTNGKSDWELTGFKKDLNKIMKSKPIGAAKSLAGCNTTWEALVKAVEMESKEPCVIPDEIPDFKKLQFDRSRAKGREVKTE